jgi:hypothetical protein
VSQGKFDYDTILGLAVPPRHGTATKLQGKDAIVLFIDGRQLITSFINALAKQVVVVAVENKKDFATDADW